MGRERTAADLRDDVFAFASCRLHPIPLKPQFHHVLRKTPRKQSQKGCSIHRHGCWFVFFRVSKRRVFPDFSLFLGDAFAGASGTGRTTFVNTLCESEVLAHKVSDNAETAHIEEGIRIKPVNVGTSCSGHDVCGRS